MPKARPLPPNVTQISKTLTKSGKSEYTFLVECINCGRQRQVRRRQHAIGHAYKHCKFCASKTNHPQGEYRGIRVSWFNKFIISAEVRSIDFAITIDDLADVLERQGYMCALTGWPITTSGDFNQITASLDRIDNRVGYTPSNIQVVHKKVNMSRGSLDIRDFVDMCKAITGNQKD